MGNVSGKPTSVTGEQASKKFITPLKGVVIAEMKRCGRHNCHCITGRLHGPFYYRYYRDRGRLRKQYVRPADLKSVLKATDFRRTIQIERRVARWQMQKLVRELKQAALW